MQELDQVVENLTTRLHQPLRLTWVWPTITTPSSSQMVTQSDSAEWTGQAAWSDVSLQEVLESNLASVRLPSPTAAVSNVFQSCAAYAGVFFRESELLFLLF